MAFLKRLGMVLASVALVTAGLAVPASAAPPPSPANPYKVNVMGEWAHPDDDTSIIGPCGVWKQLYGVRCAIVQVTRGEGGGNAVGSELGPDLGLRRENEDRAAHYRSGTVDLFFLDRVDFFYNQSAPLTEFFWGHDRTLKQVTRLIRETQPDVYIGFNPTLAAGHGNHQWAGRMIWEGLTAAADPTSSPEQLVAPENLTTWQVKKAYSGGSTAGTGGTTASAHCTTGFVPTPGTNHDTVVGVWTGYDSPYLWAPGNVQGRPAGTPKIWAQIQSEGAAAYPTQSRTQSKANSNPACSRFGQTQNYVPFQPNTTDGTTPNPLAGRDDAIFMGASIPDPGGLPLGTLEYLTFGTGNQGIFQVAGQPFPVTLHMTSGSGTINGSAALTVPAGWTTSGPNAISVGPSGDTTSVFTVTPAAAAAAGRYKISALVTSGGNTGYTDNVTVIVPPAEGRWHRAGNWAEFDQWLATRAPRAYRLGRSAAAGQSMGQGESRAISVDVHNWSAAPQTGTVTLTLPAGFGADTLSKPYGPLAPGADVAVPFVITNTNPALNSSRENNGQTYSIGAATTYDVPAGSANENLTLSLVPNTTVLGAAGAPTLDAQETSGSEYPSTAFGIDRVWQGSACNPLGVDCGSAAGTVAGDPNSSYAKVTYFNNDLYIFAHVKDDFQSYAILPSECAGHWLADSVEFLIDPRGNASADGLDTAHTFKLGVFPFSNDPTNSNGNGVNGPCWERDADANQGFSTGPLSIGNAPGVQVVSSAVWVGDNLTTTPHGYGASGGYNLEIKIPMSVLPAAIGPTSAYPTGVQATNTIDPAHVGINITPYDNDNTAAAGTTVLRHIDSSTRLAFSGYGSVQSDPYRWGHAYFPGFVHQVGDNETYDTPTLLQPGLNSADSPQAIYQAAQNGVPFAGRPKSPPNDRITISKPTLTPTAAGFQIDATGPGRAHIFLWNGNHGSIETYLNSCVPDDPTQLGFNACATTDGGIPPWQPDMTGRIVRDVVLNVSAGTTNVSVPLDQAAYDTLRVDGSALVSFESAGAADISERGAQAFDIGLAIPSVVVTDDYNPTQVNHPVTLTATASGPMPFPGTPTGTVQFKNGSANIGSPVTLVNGVASLMWTFTTTGNKTITAVYSGDGDYLGTTSPAKSHSVVTKMTTSALLLPSQPSFKYGETIVLNGSVDPSNTSSSESMATGATVTVKVNPGTGLVNLAPATPIDGAPHTTGGTINGVSYTVTITCTYPPLRCTITITWGAASDARFPVSNWSYRLAYSGNANYVAATSPSSKVAIVKTASTVSAVTFATPTTSAAPHSYSVTIAATAPGSGVPTTGTVQFKMDGANLGAAQPVVNGTATLNYGSPLPTGNHTIRAYFSGNGAFLAAYSPTTNQVVTP